MSRRIRKRSTRIKVKRSNKKKSKNKVKKSTRKNIRKKSKSMQKSYRNEPGFYKKLLSLFAVAVVLGYRNFYDIKNVINMHNNPEIYPETIFRDTRNDINFNDLYQSLENDLINKYYYRQPIITDNQITRDYNIYFNNLKDMYKFFTYASEGDFIKFSDYVKNIKDINFKDDNGNTFLINIIQSAHAGTSGDYSLITEFNLNKAMSILLSGGVDINAKNNFGQTALHIALRYYSNPKTLDFLISNGADLSSKDNIGLDALDTAFTRGKIRLVNHIIARHNKLYKWKSNTGEYLLEKLALLKFGSDWKYADILDTLNFAINRGARIPKSKFDYIKNQGVSEEFLNIIQRAIEY